MINLDRYVKQELAELTRLENESEEALNDFRKFKLKFPLDENTHEFVNLANRLIEKVQNFENYQKKLQIQNSSFQTPNKQIVIDLRKQSNQNVSNS